MTWQHSCTNFAFLTRGRGGRSLLAGMGLGLWLWLLLGVSFGWAAETAETEPPNTNTISEASAKATNAASFWEPDVQLRVYLKMQEQLHATLLAVEQSRQETSSETRTNSELLAARLASLEESLARQREQQWETVRSSNQMMLLLGAGVIGLGLIALAFTALFQSRGMNRLAQIATTISQERVATGLALTNGSEPLLLANGTGTSPAHRSLLTTIDQLQQRIRELERTANPELPFPDFPTASHEPRPGAAQIRNGGGSAILEHRPMDNLTALMGKAQVLLSLGQADEALACYDLALAHAPSEPDLHLRRGQTLERLKRHDEALVCYDRALTLNRNLTQAYLSKGAVFNLQERYSEALACYEQALRSETER